MESMEASFADFSGLHREPLSLTKVKDKCFDMIRLEELYFGEEAPNEFFDKNIRSELWLGCVDAVEKVKGDGKEAKKLLKKIIDIDKGLYQFFVTKYRKLIAHNTKKQILKQIAPSTKVAESIEDYPEFNEYVENMVKLNAVFDKIINFFRIFEFYFDMKSVKSKHRLRTKSRPWDLQILASQLGWKTVYAFTKSASYFINISFKNLHLWKYLMALAFMSFFHSSIFASALSIDLQLSTVALPIFGKTIQWLGLFDKATDMISTKEAMLYVKSLIKPAQETEEVLRKYYKLIMDDFEAEMSNEEHGIDDTSDALEETFRDKFSVFDKNFKEIEKFIENEVFGEIEVEEVEDGWMILKDKSAMELKIEQTQDFGRHF